MGPLSEGEQNRLIIECVGLIEPIAAAERGRKGIPFEDLVAQGHLGLVRAARMWDRRAQFTTYATHKIRFAILDFIRDWREMESSRNEDEIERDWHEWQVWPHTAPFESWTSLAATPEDLLIRFEGVADRAAALASAMLTFRARDRKIFLARFKRGQTLDSIAREHKISYSKAVRLLDEMLKTITETVSRIEQRRAVA